MPAGDAGRIKLESAGTSASQAGEDVILGPRAVLEAIDSGRPFNRILIASGSEKAKEASQVRTAARAKGIIVQIVDRAALDRISAGANHQGIAATVAPFDYADIDDLLNLSLGRSKPLFLVLLDGIMDPGNLGSIIRTANAAGADGIVITERRCAQISSAVVRSSAGAVEHTPVARVVNLSNAIDKVKAAGLWVAGLDMEGKEVVWDAKLTGPIAVVIGSEGAGMGRLVSQKCDFMLRIPMLGKISSLNAAVSFAVIAYEIVRQRGLEQV